MAMTGKYAVDDEAVVISAELEAAIVKRFWGDQAYDSGTDVEFHCCADGVAVDVPITGVDGPRYALNFPARGLARGSQQWIKDLKTIYEGKTAAPGKCLDKYLEVQAVE
jgi:hypothetical protein